MPGLIFTTRRRPAEGNERPRKRRVLRQPVGGAAASKKHFFRRTKIPYPDKSRLFDRGFPGRAVYFTYKVTRWITRALFFAPLPGITFLNGFYVLNSNGGLLAYLYVSRAPCHPSGRHVTNHLSPLSCLSALPPSPRVLPSLPRYPYPPRHPRPVSAGRFFAVGTISLCQTGAGLICEAFAGTSRPRIIIKIPHTDTRPGLHPRRALPRADAHLP